MTKPEAPLASSPATKAAKSAMPGPGVKSNKNAKESPDTNKDPAAAPQDAGVAKQKLVRDSFAIPKAEYAVLESLKLRAANLKRPIKKSELLRAGIASLSAMSDKAFLSALAGVPALKSGRPKGAKV